MSSWILSYLENNLPKSKIRHSSELCCEIFPSDLRWAPKCHTPATTFHARRFIIANAAWVKSAPAEISKAHFSPGSCTFWNYRTQRHSRSRPALIPFNCSQFLILHIFTSLVSHQLTCSSTPYLSRKTALGPDFFDSGDNLSRKKALQTADSVREIHPQRSLITPSRI